MRDTSDYKEWLLFGNRLRDMRLRRGLTQTTLARSLGFAHPSSISSMEKGRRPVNQEELSRIAKVLKCDIDYLSGARDIPNMSGKKNAFVKQNPYGLICSITRDCELLEPRWTIAILVGLCSGASKFNELRREVGSISPRLLSRRLKELEDLGLVERISDTARGSVDYLRTEAAIALEAALTALGEWAQCYVDAETATQTASSASLVWKVSDQFEPVSTRAG